MAEIGVMKKLTIGGSTYTIPEYNLPIASASTLGGVKIGTGLSINSTTGVLSATGLDYDEADPIFVDSPAYGITQNDIDSWNAKVSDDKTWNGVTLAKQQTTNTGDGTYVPLATSTSPINISFTPVKKTPTANAIAKYDASAYLYSTTPSASDNSTKVATTAYVDGAISQKISGVLTYKGAKASVTDVINISNPSTGDVWHVTADGSEYAYDGSTWQELGTAVDLSSYALKSEIPIVSYPVTSVNTKTGAVVLTASDVGALPDTTVIPTVPTNISAFTNDSGYITSADVPEGASAYTGTISAVTSGNASAGSNNGFARGDHVHNITKTTVDTVLGTGSGTAKFYREDGTWATPAYKTSATNSATGITASTTANKTTVGSSSTDYGVTAVGSGSFSATVTSHVLSFSHTHTAPTLGSKVPTVSTTSATVTITDNGHTHTLS